jgi:hypothetical protein
MDTKVYLVDWVGAWLVENFEGWRVGDQKLRARADWAGQVGMKKPFSHGPVRMDLMLGTLSVKWCW